MTPEPRPPDNRAVAEVTPEVGSTANQYQILAKLAVGGMAELFLARGAGVGGVERYCVLKRVLRDRSGDAQFIQMFLDEVRLAAQLHHPNIAAVYDVGMLGGSYFFTMEYVHGETVRALLQRTHALRRPVPVACALTIIAGAAAGLHHAHERRAPDGRRLEIVHRDVSPSNLIVSFEGNVKLVDFGVAKAADRGVETKSGTVKGKISYLSPEQCRGETVDRRSDLFSLGIVAWELLANSRLYRRASDFESMVAIVNERPKPPSHKRAEVPRALDDIVLRLLAKSPDERYQTAAEVIEAVEHASMRAGTLLSASAVSRLLRELFGARNEPWVELAESAAAGDPVSVQSEPIGSSTGTPSDKAPVGAVERELAGVRSLSALSNAVTDNRDHGNDLEALIETTPSGNENSTLLPGPTTAVEDVPSQVTAPLSMADLLATMPIAGSTTLRGSGVPAMRAAVQLRVMTPPRGLPGVAPLGAPMVSPLPRVALPLPAPAQEPLPVHAPMPLPPMIPEASGVTHSSYQPYPQAPPIAQMYPQPRPRPQRMWLQVTVVVVATVLGMAIAWWSSERGEPANERENEAVTEPVHEAKPPALAKTSDPPPSEIATAAPARDPVASPAPSNPPLSEPTTAPDEPAPDQAAPDKPAQDRATAETGRAPAQLTSLFRKRDYSQVIELCSKSALTGETAAVCTLAACYQRDAALAERWFTQVERSRRKQLVAGCKQAGHIDLGNREAWWTR